MHGAVAAKADVEHIMTARKAGDVHHMRPHAFYLSMVEGAMLSNQPSNAPPGTPFAATHTGTSTVDIIAETP